MKSFHPSVDLYLLIVPTGTYNVALLKVFKLKVLSYEDLPYILNGFSIFEMISGISSPSKARAPMLVTLLGMVTEVRLLQLRNVLNIDNQQLTS